jgi:DNA-binding transcriptional MerR regulator
MKFRRVIRGSFSTAEAARLAGLTPRQLDHWDRLGFLSPSVARARGYGSARRYSFGDVVRLKVAARLRASGASLARLRRCAAALLRLDGVGSADLSRARLVVSRDRVLWVRSDREVIDLVREGQLLLVFAVGEVVAETAGAVRRLGRERPVAPVERASPRVLAR